MSASGTAARGASPRRSAFRILLDLDRSSAHADVLVDKALATGSLSGPDRGFLTELVYGTLRRQGTLDHVIASFSSTKPDRLERAVLVLLRLGLYQILYLDRVPPSAAVNETVNLVKEAAPRAAGLVNAILRRAARERETIPFPNRDADPVGAIAARHSAPAWVVKMWIADLGLEEAEALGAAMAAPPPTTIRANTLKCSRDDLAARLQAEGIETRPAEYASDALHLVAHHPLAVLPSFRDGLFTIQDESSQLAALALHPQPGEDVLDLCAAPGGKATYLAQLMGDRGTVVAGDRDDRKLSLIRETATRLGMTIIEPVRLDASSPDGVAAALGDLTFDRVLVDAPCSGLGVLRRNAEARWRKKPEDIPRLAATQKQILATGADRLRAGGLLVYSTCSTSRDENERVVEDFLSRHQSFMLEDIRLGHPALAKLSTPEGYFRSWPHRHGMDGFFAALLRKQD